MKSPVPFITTTILIIGITLLVAIPTNGLLASIYTPVNYPPPCPPNCQDHSIPSNNKTETSLTSTSIPQVKHMTLQQILQYKAQLQAQGYEYQDFKIISKGLTGNVSNEQVARTGDDIYVVWQGNVNKSQDIFLSLSRDSGKNFTDPVKLSGSQATSINPQIGVLGKNVYLLWQEVKNGVSNIISSSSMNGGESFIVYPFTNNTLIGVNRNATNAKLTMPPLTFQVDDAINRTMSLKQSGYPLVTWEQQVCKVHDSIKNANTTVSNTPSLIQANTTGTVLSGSNSTGICQAELEAHGRPW